MKNFTFIRDFRALYAEAVARYAAGQRNAAQMFSPAEHAFLSANGIAAQHLYDYAEDDRNYGGPGIDHAVAIELVRRDYFLNVQHGRASTDVLDVSTMPSKSETVSGIAWLPRLLPKARAKLRGELPASLMFGCGGDRAFFEEHDILPSEFLALRCRHENDDAAVVAWVVRRKKWGAVSDPPSVRILTTRKGGSETRPALRSLTR